MAAYFLGFTKRIWQACLLLGLGAGMLAAGCTPALPAAASPTAPSPVTSTPTLTLLPSPSPTPRPPTATPTASPTPIPPSATPTPTRAPAVIAPGNLSALTQAAQISYNTWDLVLDVAWSTGGEQLAVAAGESVYIYQTEEFDLLHTLAVGSYSNDIVYAPATRQSGGNVLGVAARDGSLQFWDTSTGLSLCRLAAHPREVTSLAFSSQGGLVASTGSDAIVRLWNLEGLLETGDCPGQPPAEMIGGAFAVPAIAFHPSGSQVASVDKLVVRLRDPQSLRLISTLRGEVPIFSLAYHPAGELLAWGEQNATVRMWDLATFTPVTSLSLPPMHYGSRAGFVWDLAFQARGDVLAAGLNDTRLVVWDLSADPPAAQILLGHTLAVTSVAFSPDGLRLASGSLDATVRIWMVR